MLIKLSNNDNGALISVQTTEQTYKLALTFKLTNTQIIFGYCLLFPISASAKAYHLLISVLSLLHTPG